MKVLKSEALLFKGLMRQFGVVELEHEFEGQVLLSLVNFDACY